jgi:hypothetical protein
MDIPIYSTAAFMVTILETRRKTLTAKHVTAATTAAAEAATAAATQAAATAATAAAATTMPGTTTNMVVGTTPVPGTATANAQTIPGPENAAAPNLRPQPDTVGFTDPLQDKSDQSLLDAIGRMGSEDGHTNPFLKSVTIQNSILGLKQFSSGQYSPAKQPDPVLVDWSSSLKAPPQVTNMASMYSPPRLEASRDLFGDEGDDSKKAKKVTFQTASFQTIKSREEAPDGYIALCVLLSHSAKEFGTITLAAGHVLPASQVILPREPCVQARRFLLSALTSGESLNSSAEGYLESILQYKMEGPFKIAGASQGISTSFLTSIFVKSVFRLGRWKTNPSKPPPPIADGFSIYNFNVVVDASWPSNLIPSDGYAVGQANHMGMMILAVFTSLDCKSGTDRPRFLTSLFGKRLSMIAQFPGNAAFQSLWGKNPRLLSWIWTTQLSKLLEIFRSFIKMIQFHCDGTDGFADAVVNDKVVVAANSLTRDTSILQQEAVTLYHRLERFDIEVASIWYQKSQDPLDSLWASAPPGSFFQGSTGVAKLPPPFQPGPYDQLPPRIKQEGQEGDRKRGWQPRGRPDFVTAAPLLEFCIPIGNEPAMTVLHRNIKLVRYPKLLNNGKLHQLCMKCAFPAPDNECWFENCEGRSGAKKKKGKYRGREDVLPRLHIDPTDPEWAKNVPEYWLALVEWLKDPVVRIICRASAATKRMMGPQNW